MFTVRLYVRWQQNQQWMFRSLRSAQGGTTLRSIIHQQTLLCAHRGTPQLWTLNKLVHEHHKLSDLQIMQSWKNTLKNIVHKNLVSKKDVKMSFNFFMESTLLIPHDTQLALDRQQLQIKSKLLY